MARAILHLICGNCGCNDEWEWEHVPEVADEGEIITNEDVFIACCNCATLHCISDNAKPVVNR
ncbi:MAG: hypothetical protein V3V84_07770 [Candidatus Bathyarchaeia archaeon]